MNIVNIIRPDASQNKPNYHPWHQAKVIHEVHQRPNRAVFYFTGGSTGNMHTCEEDESNVTHNGIKRPIEKWWKEGEYAWLNQMLLAIPNQYIIWLVSRSFFNDACLFSFLMQVMAIWVAKLILIGDGIQHRLIGEQLQPLRLDLCTNRLSRCCLPLQLLNR